MPTWHLRVSLNQVAPSSITAKVAFVTPHPSERIVALKVGPRAQYQVPHDVSVSGTDSLMIARRGEREALKFWGKSRLERACIFSSTLELICVSAA